MVSKLKKPDVNHYSNANCVEFHETLYQIFDKNKDTINAPLLLSAYRDKVQQESTGFNRLRSSEFTEKKAETDYRRKRVLVQLTGVLRPLAKHFNPAIREQARHVLMLIRNFGNLVHSQYDAATADIDRILEWLATADYRPAVEALRLDSWLTELERLNGLFKTYAVDMEREVAQKPDILPEIARRETNVAMRRITDRIEALIDLNGDAAFALLVKEFNVHVEHYNTLLHEHYGRLHAKVDLSSGNLATINEQPYTGRPVFVIPSVSIRREKKDGSIEWIELVFSRDFRVAYRNNVGPGTATLVITGIGRYAGELVTGFHIRREAAPELPAPASG
jgi:hypothetical protein